MTNKQKVIDDYFKAIAKRFRKINIGGYVDDVSPDEADAVWIPNEQGGEWVRIDVTCPNIIDHFPSFKKWVIEKMEDAGVILTFGNKYVIWAKNFDDYIEPIKDNEITLAAVISATGYWRNYEKNQSNR